MSENIFEYAREYFFLKCIVFKFYTKQATFTVVKDYEQIL
jgi:hypothetical protein